MTRSDRTPEAVSLAFGDALEAASGDEAEAMAMACLRSGMSIESLYGKVIAPAMWRIGRRWRDRKITIADEHMATAITLRVMARAYSFSIKHGVARPGRIVLAAVEGQRHDLGLRMAGDVLEIAGYEVVDLGSDVPVGSVAASVKRFEPDLIGLSTVLDSSADSVGQEVRLLHETFPDTPVVIGGSAVPEDVLGIETVYRIDGFDDLIGLVEEMLDRWGVATHSDVATGPGSPLSPNLAGSLDSPEDHLLEVVTDTTEEVGSQARIARSYMILALEDGITGGPNRRAFDDRLRLLATTFETHPVGLLILDLDHFTRVNEARGHRAGDQLLRETARAIQSSLRAGDFAARLGGDEFGILLPQTELEDAGTVAADVLSAVRNIPEGPSTTASIGICRVDQDPREAMTRAVIALQQAKQSGRDRSSAAADSTGG